jgi:uncharacterized protein (DUF4415 family)
MKQIPSTKHSAKPRPDQTDWNKVRQLTDADIAAAVADDPDAAPIADAAWFAKARVTIPDKKPVSLRLDSDILAFFQEAGPRYQTRINQVLRAYVEAHKKRA